MKWSETYRINTHDCDAGGMVRASLVLRYMQETANLQLRNLGPTEEELRSHHMAFWLARLQMMIHLPLYAGENITVTTWSVDSKGASFQRCYQIHRGEELIAEATSVWGLVDTDTHALHRVSEMPFPFKSDTPLSLDMPKRIFLPSELSWSEVGKKDIKYSDIDRNGHMNNTNYPDMLCDCLPHMQEKRVHTMGINFTGEAKYGEHLTIFSAEQEGNLYFRTVRADATPNIEAVVTLCAR